MTSSTEQYSTSSTNTSSNGEPSKNTTAQEKEIKKAELAQNTWDLATCIAHGCEVSSEAHWWGYKIILNHEAAVAYATILSMIEDRLPKCFKGEIRRAISFALQLKEHRITKADQRSNGQGCQFVSPWVLPFALTVVRNNSGDDQHLWFTVWDSEQKTWGEEAEFTGPDVLSLGGPALAQHGDLLYCVHRGGTDDTALYWTVYSTDDGWCDDQRFPTHRSETTPSLTEFQGKLYCFYQGAGNSYLYFCNLNAAGDSWENDATVKVNGNDLNCINGCGVTVFSHNNVNQLHLVYQDKGSNQIKHLWTTDLKTWNSVSVNSNWITKDTPAIVAYNNKILMVHCGCKNNYLYYSLYDGSSWSSDENTIPGENGTSNNAGSNYGVGLAVFEGKVYMVHRSSEGNGNLWFSTYSSSGWSGNQRIEEQYTGETPALACYKDPKVTPENYDATATEPGMTASRLICVHRGWGK